MHGLTVLTLERNDLGEKEQTLINGLALFDSVLDGAVIVGEEETFLCLELIAIFGDLEFVDYRVVVGDFLASCEIDKIHLALNDSCLGVFRGWVFHGEGDKFLLVDICLVVSSSQSLLNLRVGDTLDEDFEDGVWPGADVVENGFSVVTILFSELDIIECFF